MKHEQKEKKEKVLSEIGYGIMWLFLSALLELLIYLEHVQRFFYHYIAFLMALAAVFKFVVGYRKYRKLKEEIHS